LQPLSTPTGEGFRDAENHSTVVFRTKPGPLSTGKLSTDGAMLAATSLNGAEEFLSSDVSLLQRDQHPIIASHPTSDIALRESPGLNEIYVSCSAVTDLKFYLQRSASEVELDGARIMPSQTGGLISINNLATGDHLVTIRY
jgi:hypothetical protein